MGLGQPDPVLIDAVVGAAAAHVLVVAADADDLGYISGCTTVLPSFAAAVDIGSFCCQQRQCSSGHPAKALHQEQCLQQLRLQLLLQLLWGYYPALMLPIGAACWACWCLAAAWLASSLLLLPLIAACELFCTDP
jgi:hypothetical protein